MKTSRLENKSRRPHNIRISKIISPALVSHVLEIRQAEPMYGKEKIKRELEKDGIFTSVSTVGRILKYLMDKGKIQNIKLLKMRASTVREREERKRYAERIRNQKPEKPGQLIQFDHMVLNLYNSLHIKEFSAVEPTRRISISRIYNSTNAVNAQGLLKEAIFKLDFPIESIQIVGDSEFMGNRIL